MDRKIWVITGVSKGLGMALAEKAATSGDLVIGTVRNEDDKIKFENNPNCRAKLLDLTKTSEISKMIEEVLNEFGRIDILVNNAGYGAFGMVEEFSEEEVRQQLDVNLFAVWKLCQSAIPSMRKHKSGTIVQISSRMGLQAGMGNGIYAAGKFAVEAISESLHKELKPFGIRVILVEPGAMRTDFFGGSVKYAANKISGYKENGIDIREKTKAVHGNQKGSPEKIASVIFDAVKSDNDKIFRIPLTQGTIDTLNAKADHFKNLATEMAAAAASVDEKIYN